MNIRNTIELAYKLQNEGKTDQAEHLYREILKLLPNNAGIHYNLGILSEEQGHVDEALGYYKKVLQLDPNFTDAYFNTGVLLHKRGLLDEAIDYFQKALQRDPYSADINHNLGIALRDRGRLDEAIVCLEKALEIDPQFTSAGYNLAIAYNNLGTIYQKEGNLHGAIPYYQKAINLNPTFAEAHYNLGNCYKDLGNLKEAITSYHEGLQHKPNVEVYNNLGGILTKLGKTEESLEWYQRALELDPNAFFTYYNLGRFYFGKGQFNEAIAYFQKALQLNPDLPEAYCALGQILHRKGKFNEAIAYCQKALELNPKCIEAYCNMGTSLQSLGKLEEAVKNYNYALQLNPNLPVILNNLGGAFSEQGKVNEAEICYRKALQMNPSLQKTYSKLFFLLLYNDKYDAEKIFKEHVEFGCNFEKPLLLTITPHKNTCDPERRLRIGYVSPDFRRHSVAFFIEPVLRTHDKQYVEIFCYANSLAEDVTTKRLKSYADHWRNIYLLDDEHAAEMIKADKIDILVDLAGHTAHSRLLLFARKPAPIQVTWLGYPATTGLSSMNYKIVDSYTNPPEMTDRLYTEELLRLPESFLCFLPDKESPNVGGLKARKTGYITFGSFNWFSKISFTTLELWTKVLQCIPDAKLILKTKSFSDEKTCDYIMNLLSQRGIQEKRVELIPFIPIYKEHLETYNRIDIGLDTFPYNGTTTTCEALWMGVPVITLAGQAHASRVGTSILSNIGLPDLVANTPDEFVNIAVQLAGDLNRLKMFRKELRNMMARSILTDAERFTLKLERCYRDIWEKWCKFRVPN